MTKSNTVYDKNTGKSINKWEYPQTDKRHPYLSLVKSWMPSPQDQNQVKNASPFVLTISTQHCAGGSTQGINKEIEESIL